MKIKNSISDMYTLLMDYSKIWKRKSIRLIAMACLKVAVNHELHGMRPKSILFYLELDPALNY